VVEVSVPESGSEEPFFYRIFSRLGALLGVLVSVWSGARLVAAARVSPFLMDFCARFQHGFDGPPPPFETTRNVFPTFGEPSVVPRPNRKKEKRAVTLVVD